MNWYSLKKVFKDNYDTKYVMSHIFCTHLLPSIWMSILPPQEIVTPGAGDTLGTVDRLCAGVGLGTKDELGA